MNRSSLKQELIVVRVNWDGCRHSIHFWAVFSSMSAVQRPAFKGCTPLVNRRLVPRR